MCRTAPAGLALWAELNRAHPHRNRASDGACPSFEHHQSNPTSDHEPWVWGISCALDTTHDPANGVDAHGALAEELKDDHRVKYAVRFNAQRGYDEIWSNERGDTHWRPNGSGDDHRSHLHLSFWHSLAVLNDTRAWLGTEKPPKPPEDDMAKPVMVAPNFKLADGTQPTVLTEYGSHRGTKLNRDEAQRQTAAGVEFVFLPRVLWDLMVVENLDRKA